MAGEGILVGTARISLTPDARGFVEKARADVSAALAHVDARVPLLVDLDAASVAKARAALGPLAGGKRIPLQLDQVNTAPLRAKLNELAKAADKVKIGADDKPAVLAMLRVRQQLLALDKVAAEPSVDLEGFVRTEAELTALDLSLDKLGGTAGGAEAAVGPAGLSGASGFGALVAAGVAVSPIIATVGVGLVGLAAAGYGVLSPVEKAATAAGGLRANMAKLNPEQRKLAGSLLGLGAEYSHFEKALQPEVVGIFGQAVRLAGHVMHDVQPVARATGKAFTGFLGQLDAEFQSGTWQQFFGWMAREAGPDVRLLGDDIIALTHDLPGLLEQLQPLARATLQVTGGIAKLIGGIENVNTATANWSTRTAHSGGVLGTVWGDIVQISNHIKGAPGELAKSIGLEASSSDKAAKSTSRWNGSLAATTPHIMTMAQRVNLLTTAMNSNVSAVLSLQGDDISWRQSLQAATKQLDSNKAGLRGNSAAALANKAAVLQATNNVVKFATDQLTMHGNLKLASQEIQAQITWLEKHGQKSKFAAAEIKALRLEEAKIKREIRNSIIVHANGTWTVTGAGVSGAQPGKRYIPGGVGSAAGWRVPGYGGGDRWPALLEGGEAVVPKHLTPALAPFLKAHGVPGFAAGGLAPGSYAGAVPGLTKWVAAQEKATVHAIEAATARATLAGMQAAAQTFAGGLGRAGLRYLENLWIGAGGPGGGTAHVAAAIALAESGGNFNALNPSGAAGGWQILGQVVPGNIFDPHINALNAVKKYRDAGGFSPWVTYEDRAYLRFMDRGGILPPGLSLAANMTGHDELVLNASQLRQLGSGVGDTNYIAHFDAASGVLEQKIRSAFHAMEVAAGRRGRIGRQQ